MTRRRIVFGSLLGAAAIHLVLLACSTPRIEPSDGGIFDSALDAMGMLGDAETRDAVAQEAGGMCSCPGPARTTFAGSIDLGSGNVTTRSQGARASAGVEPYIYASGDTGYRIVVSASFWTAGSPIRYQVGCTLYGGGRGSSTRAPSNCVIAEERDGAGVWTGTTTSVVGTVNEISDTALEVQLGDVAAMNSGRTVTARGFRFRTSAPGGGLIPGSALEPM